MKKNITHLIIFIGLYYGLTFFIPNHELIQKLFPGTLVLVLILIRDNEKKQDQIDDLKSKVDSAEINIHPYIYARLESLEKKNK